MICGAAEGLGTAARPHSAVIIRPDLHYSSSMSPKSLGSSVAYCIHSSGIRSRAVPVHRRISKWAGQLYRCRLYPQRTRPSRLGANSHSASDHSSKNGPIGCAGSRSIRPWRGKCGSYCACWSAWTFPLQMDIMLAYKLIIIGIVPKVPSMVRPSPLR